MIVIKQFIKIITTLLLIVALMLPTAIQFFHCCDSHEHTVCNDEQSTHFHEAKPDCNVCHFNQQPFNYDLICYTETIETYYIKEVKSRFLSLIHSIKINTPQLRGPPSILI